MSEKRTVKGTFMENLELDDFPFDVQVTMLLTLFVLVTQPPLTLAAIAHYWLLSVACAAYYCHS